MKKDNMNILVNRAFLRAHPLKTLGLIFTFAFGLSVPAAVAYDIDNIAKQEKKTLTQVVSDRWANIGFGVLGAWIMVLVTAGLIFNTEQERAAAEYIIKRKIRSIVSQRKDISLSNDEQSIKDFGDLLVANMTKQEKRAIIKTARDFSKSVSLGDKMADIEPSKLDKVIAIQEIEKVVNGVLMRNPAVINVLIDAYVVSDAPVLEKQYS
ncbi:MAG: hypothetical protein K5912_02690 [Alphaproteobacteria bacterium]|nr:hypothetical protein [Alphaproteobacteria bacterium]